MNGMGVPLIAQLCLAFGWPSGYRTVRANSIAAIILALLLFLGIWARPH